MDPNAKKAPFTGIAFVHYPCRDLERTLAFYQNVLGLRLLHRTAEWLEFEIGGQRLAFHRQGGTGEPSSKGGATVWLETDDLTESLQYLLLHGVNPTGPMEEASYGKTVRFLDPEGNVIGLYQAGRK